MQPRAGGLCIRPHVELGLNCPSGNFDILMGLRVWLPAGVFYIAAFPLFRLFRQSRYNPPPVACRRQLARGRCSGDSTGFFHLHCCEFAIRHPAKVYEDLQKPIPAARHRLYRRSSSVFLLLRFVPTLRLRARSHFCPDFPETR